MPGPAVAVHQVFAQGVGVIVQPQLPRRQFEAGLLGVVRVEADRYQDVVVALGRALGEIQDVVVPAVEERHAQVRLQARFCRRMRLSCAISAMMLPGWVKSRGRISYFSESRYSSPCPAGVCLRTAPARVHAPQPRPHGRQRGSDQKTRTATGVQEERVDVRRVDEEVGPVAQASGWLIELLEILAQFLFGIAPGESDTR